MATVSETYGSGTIPKIGDTKRMLMVKDLIADNGGTGSGGVGLFSGNGSPVGVIFPTTDTALYLQKDSTPAGLIWSYFSGTWHQ
jgi:hypothetical protein